MDKEEIVDSDNLKIRFASWSVQVISDGVKAAHRHVSDSLKGLLNH